MIKISLLLGFVFISVAVLSDEKPLNTSKGKAEVIKPAMRPMDRDWQYFSEQSCDEINKFVGHSTKEKKLIIKRKKQCMDKYKAFLPQPINR
jgi:hypothetical protein